MEEEKDGDDGNVDLAAENREDEEMEERIASFQQQVRQRGGIPYVGSLLTRTTTRYPNSWQSLYLV